MLIYRVGFIKTTGSFILLIIIGAGLLMLWNRFRADPEPSFPDTPVVKFTDRPAQAPLRVLIVATTDDERQAIICEEGRCQATTYPAAESNAVSDGESWYYYHDDEENNRKILKRIEPNSGTIEDLIESTPLTEPRDLIISPDGRRVAFFLDNIAEPAKQLTELWIYDVETASTRLIAERLYQPDIRTRPRWNESSTHLYFIADTGEQDKEEDQLELIVVNTQPPAISAAFANIKWADFLDRFLSTTMDLAVSGDQLAYPDSGLLGQTILRISSPDGNQRTNVRGSIPYLQWLEDNSLLYAIQDSRGFTFWRRTAETNRFVAHRPGTLKSARSDVSGQYLAFIVGNDAGGNQLHSLHIASGIILDEGTFPDDAGDLFIVHVKELPEPVETHVAGISSELDPEEIAAFIDNNLQAITGYEAVQPLRFLTTDQINTVFVDYRKPDDEEERLLLTIHDAIHVEWSIKGRYRAVNNEWQKIQASGVADPTASALYEWESDLNQWILKEDFSSQ